MFGEIKSSLGIASAVVGQVRRQGPAAGWLESNVVTVTPVAAESVREASGFQPRNLPRVRENAERVPGAAVPASTRLFEVTRAAREAAKLDRCLRRPG